MKDDDLSGFRQDLRGWLQENCPEEMCSPGDENTICWGGRNWVFHSSAQEKWLKAMVAKGWTVPTWPKQYGGAGFDRAQEKILHEEMARIGARSPLNSFGIWMLGPALLRYGSADQKERFLPEIARGEIRWCQGYSEPGAGSDLAGLQTRAEDMGDHYLVNGQKVWTSYADKADWIFALVRTDREAPKHKGISFLLIDMQTPGVSTRPIRLISGKSPFCETFFDNVKVPKENIVGEVNQGWTIAKYLLTHEREMIAGGAQGLLGGRSLVSVVGESRPDDACLRADALRCEVNTLAVGLMLERFKDEAEEKGGLGDVSAMLKYAGTELNKQRYEVMMAAAGSDALVWDGHDGLAAEWLRTKANSIEGGTSEVMLSILSKRVLGLPG